MLPFDFFRCVQEKLKREQLRKELEIKSSDNDEQVQRAFAKALEMQQQSAEEVATLKAELELTKRSNEENLHAITQQVSLFI